MEGIHAIHMEETIIKLGIDINRSAGPKREAVNRTVDNSIESGVQSTIGIEPSDVWTRNTCHGLESTAEQKLSIRLHCDGKNIGSDNGSRIVGHIQISRGGECGDAGEHGAEDADEAGNDFHGGECVRVYRRLGVMSRGSASLARAS